MPVMTKDNVPDDAVARKRAYDQRYYLANAERIKARVKAAYHANPEPAIQRVTRWVKRNPVRVVGYKQAHYAANMDTIKQRVADWNEANPEATRARGRNYRARLFAAEGEHTGDDIKALYAKQRGRCVYCNVKLGDSYHVDHIQPLARGGSNWPSNLQLTCERCNNRKRATDPIEFARRAGKLL
jgi:5-methylcytosine-specific restriction endonuclease McrA